MRRIFTIPLVAIPLGLLLASTLPGQRHKNKKQDEEPRPQIRETVLDPPDALAVETGRLTFQVSPLSDKGLLSQQVRDALKAIEKLNHGGTVVRLRAFVAGSGDLRRVKEIVSEEFTEHKQPLPVVTTIQAGALPKIGAQVVIESITVDKKIVNPMGLAFFSGTAFSGTALSGTALSGTAEVPAKDIITPSIDTALARLKQAMSGAQVKAGDVQQVTCFLSSLDEVQMARSSLAAAFPMAAVNFIQKQRLGVEPRADCEAVGRLSVAPTSPVAISAGVARVNSAKLVLTGTQLAFRDQESDFRLAFQRLVKTLGPLGVTPQDIFWLGTYSLTRPSATKIEGVQWEFLDRSHPPAGTSLLFEGLPSVDATGAIELMAAKN